MNVFAYRDGVLHAEDVPLPRIADSVGTPFYCYSAARLSENYRSFDHAFRQLGAEICYSVKSNSNQAVISNFARMGAGADVVSEGELRRALAAGVEASRVVFSGVGKRRDEIAAALAVGCGQINVESEAELKTIAEVAAATGRTAMVAFRVNPDVDAQTHDKIATGRAGDKFGINFSEVAGMYRRAETTPGLRPVGLAVHIGSQLTSLDPFRSAFERIASLVRTLRTNGCRVERVDLGGGLGIAYRDETPPEIRSYAELVGEIFSGLDLRLILEPGRHLTADAGILVTQVILLKAGGGRRFVIVDAAMNDLIRPALYGAWHEILPVRQPQTGCEAASFDVVGPVCESGDVLAVQRLLPSPAPGDLLAVGSAGAYGAVMASTYNSRLLAPEVMVGESGFSVIRAREDYDKLIAMDYVPEWLKNI